VCSHVTVNGQVGSQRAERSPFDEFYAAESPALLALAVGLSTSREAARDVVQEAFLRAFRDWERISTLDRPGAWVRRVLINLAIDAHRRAGREGRALSRVATREVVFGEIEIDEFWRSVRSLPDRQRAAIALRYVEDMTVEAIAQLLDVSVGTVTKSLFMGRKALALRLGLEDSR
jgi:RNA polymerase sigma-70 factor (ECF subfamily)